MKAICFDAQTGRELEVRTVGGTVGFISWRRLCEVLASAGELRPGETVKSFQVDPSGITYRVVIS